MADPRKPGRPAEEVDGAIPVVTQTGTTGYLPKEFAAEADDAGGVHRASAGQMAHEQAAANESATDAALEEKYGHSVLSSLEGQYGPRAAGMARGLTFGLSDDALLSGADFIGGSGAREGVRHKLADYLHISPYDSAFAEVGGTAVGALLGQEEGLLSPAGIVAKGGRALESGIARAIGEESAISRGAGKILGGAAAGAFENGLYSAGKAESDAAIHNEELTGEQLVAATTHGIAFGGGLGAAFGGLSSFASETLGRARAGHLADAEVPTGPPAPKGSIADRLQELSDKKFFKALGGSAGDIRAIERSVPGGYRRVAQDVATDLKESTGTLNHSREALHEYATKRVDELGESLGSQLEKLDEAKTGIAPSPKLFAQQVRKEVIEPMLIAKADGTMVPMPGAQDPVRAVEGWLGSIDSTFDGRQPTFREWQKIRRNLDLTLKYEAKNVTPSVDSLRQMRAIMENHLIDSGEAAAASVGGAFQAKYQATKSLYQSVKKAEELTARGVSRDVVNNSAGLTARLATLAGASIGSAAGPAGAVVGGAIGGAIGHTVQRRGDVLAADLLSRAAAIAGANRVAGRVTSELESGVRKLIPAKLPAIDRLAEGAETIVRRASGPLGVKMTGTQRGDYAKLSDTVTSSVANPVATSDRISRSLGPLADHAPGTASAAIQTTLRGLDFLASKLPPSRADQFSLQPQLEKGTRASDAEISRFMRYAQAVDDPLVVLREAKTNTLTRDHVEAVKAVYPNLYDEIRSSVFRSLVESKTELPYARRIQLGILLDIPTDKTLSPAFIRAAKATYTSTDQAEAESPSPTGAAPNIAGSFQTSTQSAAEPMQ